MPGRRVLIADTDPQYAASLGELLEDRAYQVQIASGADEALDRLATFDAPVVLMDVRLGCASNGDLLSRLLARHPNAHCIMMAPHAEVNDAIVTMRLGAYDYYEKSASPADLYAILRRAFERHQLMRERERSEAQLIQQKLHLDTALSHMSQGLAMFDAAGRMVLCNERYIELFRLPPDVARPGATVSELLEARAKAGTFAGDVEQHRLKMLSEIARGETVTCVQEIADGCAIRTIRRPMASGGWVTTQEDITEQRRAEQERDLGRAFLNTVIENIPLMVAVKDARDLRYVLVNPEAEKLHGVSRSEMIGKDVFDLFDEATAALITEQDREVLRSGGQLTAGEHFVQTIKNGIRLVATKRLVIPDEKGTPKYLLSVIEDITDRKQVEEAGRRNAEILAATITSMVDAVLVMDENGKVLIANPAARRLFGDDPDMGSEEWASRYSRFQPDGTTPFPHHETPLSRARRGESVDNMEIVLRGLGMAEPIHLIANGRPFRDSTGAARGAVLVYHDVTKARDIERQLRQAQKMDAIGQLTGGVAHDFNNILTVITGTIEILAEGVADRPKLAAIAKMIDQAAERGSELTRHLLAFARKQPLRPRKTDVTALIVDASKLLRPTLGERIEIESMLVSECWPALVDPSQLTTALLNLAVNARDAMPDGGKITFETENVEFDEACARLHGDVEPGRYVMIAVSDTGSGIPAAIREKVFEPFFTTKGVGNGTGLGLSMVYGFVRQSGGYIKLYSEEGRGTTIKIFLPRAAQGAERSPGYQVSAPLAGGREMILVVEDDELVRQNVIAQLHTLGYSTREARNAREALEMIEANVPFDLLFTDVIMPGMMNGSQFAQAALQRRPGTKVLFTSGYTENALPSADELDSGVLLLSKPYRKADLARMVRQALDQPAIDEKPIVPVLDQRQRIPA